MPILSALSFGSRGYGFIGANIFPATITASQFSIAEGDSVVFTINTQLNTGVTLYWSLSGVNHSDISGGVLAGSFTTSGSNENTSNTVVITTLVDADTDTDSLVFQLRTDDFFGPIVAVSPTVTINNTTPVPGGTFSYNYSSGTSNGTTTASPANVYFRRNIFQTVYTAAELNANGATSGAIFNKLRWYITGAVPASNSVRGLNIRLFHTTASDGSTVASPIGGESKTTVYSVSDTTDVTQFETTGNALFNFSNTFTWNGTNNICIESCTAQNETNYVAAGLQRIFNISNGSRYSWTDSTGTSCSVTPGTVQGFKPSVEMDYTGGGASPAPTATITPTSSSINENQSVTFNVSTTNFTSGTLYWSLLGLVNGSDFTSGLSGSFSVSGSAGSVTLTTTDDLLTEGVERFQLQVRTGSTSGTIIGSSSTVTISDTSINPTVSVTPSTTNLNEGSSVTFTVNTTNFASGTLNWDTILSADMEGSDIDVTSGTVTISGSTGSIAITATADGYTETGQTESFQVRVYHPNGIDILATSSVVTINDTSTGTPEPSGIDITSAFYEISNRHIDSDIYMGSAADYNGPYDVGEVQTDFSGSGRVYIGVKVTAATTFYNDIPIAGVQIVSSNGSTLLASWIFNTSTGGSGSGWQTYIGQIAGSSTQGFPVTPAIASGYSYTNISSGAQVGRFNWATSTGSSNTGAEDGIGDTYKLTADGGSNTLAPVGDAQISQTSNTYYAYVETSTSTRYYGAVMRSPSYTFSGGEKIRVIHAITGYSVDPMDPNDSLYVAVI